MSDMASEGYGSENEDASPASNGAANNGASSSNATDAAATSSAPVSTKGMKFTDNKDFLQALKVQIDVLDMRKQFVVNIMCNAIRAMRVHICGVANVGDNCARCADG